MLAALALLQKAKPFYWRNYIDQTLLHPLGATALVVLGILTFTLPRRKAIFPLLTMACFVSSAQRISLGGLDLTLLRLIIFFGLIRLFVKGEWREIRICRPDKLIIGWAVVQATAYVLLHKKFGSVIYMSARMFEGLGTYFLVRGLIRDWRGERQEVHVTERGYLWRGRSYGSLSAVARAITGSNRNGPKFFGLRAPEGAGR